MKESAVRNLAAATIMQAVRDFFRSPKKQSEILKDLRSPWMELFTDGMSVIVAEQLELHPKEIAERIKHAKM